MTFFLKIVWLISGGSDYPKNNQSKFHSVPILVTMTEYLVKLLRKVPDRAENSIIRCMFLQHGNFFRSRQF